MKKAIISILSIFAIGLTAVAFDELQPVGVSAQEAIVYVASTGSDENDGTNASPYKTLGKALTEVDNGGTIILKDTITLNEWTAHGKTVTITGGTLDVSGLPESEFNDGKGTKIREIVINDSVTFTNLTWELASTLDTFIYANGYETTIGERVSYFNDNVRLFGGEEGTTVDTTNLTVLSGTYNYIYGGSFRSTVTGDTNLTVGGTVNNTPAVDTAIKNHSDKYYIYGGGYVDTIQGKTNVTVSENMKAVYVYGGAYGWGSKISKGTNLTVAGGTMMSVFGGTKGADAGSSANTRIEAGSMQQVFGGNENFTLTGNVDLCIVGGTITRRIYAGCYGDGEKNYLVSGKINLELGGDVNITLNENHDDRGIYGRSRYEGDAEDCQIVFTSQSAYDSYKNKLGGSDWGASYVMGSTPAADSYHYYTYTEADGVITQSCAYHPDLSATVTIEKDETASMLYTGSEIIPVTIDVSSDWEYNTPTIEYQNNVQCGKASYTITAGQVCVEDSFIIVETPTILGGSVRTADPSGLRFQSKIPSGLVDSGATFGTLLIPKAVLGDNELTHDTSKVEDVEQEKWATESVRVSNPKEYEEGFDYFNAVLKNIPASHYDKVIVARSYVFANGQYYYAEPVERSIAQVAAYALQDDYTNDKLYEYVDEALKGSTVTMEESIEIRFGDSYQLELTGNKGYVAIWSSSDESVVSVDNGKLTAMAEKGTATITAKLGNITVTCMVTAKQRWTGYY